jgi:hypothetical protein
LRTVTLEQQLTTLAELGLVLDRGVTVGDLEHSFARDSYEARPFDLLLFMFGAEIEREPWGRRFSSSAWNFDTECITGRGSYVAIAEQLCALAGRPDAFVDLCDHVDREAEEAWVEYSIDGTHRHWNVEVDDDWADMMVVSAMMSDLERNGRKFRAKDNGQAMVLFYLDDDSARRLSELAGEALTTPTNP